ncbi:MAG: hypothetical protein JWO20_693 [Candidatus Angelobacter sp.]|nr:hypothetical protein [Candidatus Angelobacter sp.]
MARHALACSVIRIVEARGLFETRIMKQHFSSSLLICILLLCGSSAFAQKIHTPKCGAGTHLAEHENGGFYCEANGGSSSSGSSSSTKSGSSAEQKGWAAYAKAERDYDNHRAAYESESAAAREAGRCSSFGALEACADAKRRQASHENNASNDASSMQLDNAACHNAINQIKAARAAGSSSNEPLPTGCKGDGQKINPLKH